MDFSLKRHQKLIEVFSRLYSTQPDAKVYSSEYRDVLARCMATKIVYGVTYDDDIELILKRINK